MKPAVHWTLATTLSHDVAKTVMIHMELAGLRWDAQRVSNSPDAIFGMLLRRGEGHQNWNDAVTNHIPKYPPSSHQRRFAPASQTLFGQRGCRARA